MGDGLYLAKEQSQKLKVEVRGSNLPGLTVEGL